MRQALAVAVAYPAAPIGQLVTIITARLPSHTRSGIGLSARHDGYEGRFHRLTLASVFQPIVAPATGQTMGHEGFVRCGGDRPLSPWSLFSLAASNADPDWLVALDRLCRTLHAAFEQVSDPQFGTDLLGALGHAFVEKRGVTGDDKKTR